MYGYADAAKTHGMSFVCIPSDRGADSVAIVAIPSTDDFTLRPGAHVAVRFGEAEFDAEIMTNDSSAATAVVEGQALDGLFAEIERTEALPVSIVGLGQSIEIPNVSWDESHGQFAQACGT